MQVIVQVEIMSLKRSKKVSSFQNAANSLSWGMNSA